MSASEHLVFITGRMAKARLEKVASTLPTERFTWSIADAGVTSLSAELGRQVGVKDVTTAVADAVSGALDGQIRVALTQ